MTNEKNGVTSERGSVAPLTLGMFTFLTFLVIILFFPNLYLGSRTSNKAPDALEQKMLASMANNTPITFMNEQFKIVQYDMETHKVLLRGKTGELVVSTDRLTN